MKSKLCSILSVLTLINHVFAAHIVRAATCDVDQAYSLLSGLSTGASWCTSYVHVTKVTTKTKTSTATVTGQCTTSTKTKTVHAVFTETVYGKTSTLPTITRTEYSSTVLVPSGTHPSINKRVPDTATPANQAATPAALTNCAAQTISAACSSLACTTTVTTKITVTDTKTKKCVDTTTSTTTVTDRTSTTKIPFLVSPAPIILSSPGVLTTTVPAVCASTPYYANGNGVGNMIQPVDYPVFAQTDVECCVACFNQENCVASAVIYADDEDTMVAECDFLIHTDGTQPGVTKQCPLGIQDYPFGSPQAGGNVFPGPCGI